MQNQTQNSASNKDQKITQNKRKIIFSKINITLFIFVIFNIALMALFYFALKNKLQDKKILGNGKKEEAETIGQKQESELYPEVNFSVSRPDWGMSFTTTEWHNKLRCREDKDCVLMQSNMCNSQNECYDFAINKNYHNELNNLRNGIINIPKELYCPKECDTEPKTEVSCINTLCRACKNNDCNKIIDYPEFDVRVENLTIETTSLSAKLQWETSGYGNPPCFHVEWNELPKYHIRDGLQIKAPSNSYTIKNLKPNQKYDFLVAACKTWDGRERGSVEWYSPGRMRKSATTLKP